MRAPRAAAVDAVAGSPCWCRWLRAAGAALRWRRRAGRAARCTGSIEVAQASLQHRGPEARPAMSCDLQPVAGSRAAASPPRRVPRWTSRDWSSCRTCWRSRRGRPSPSSTTTTTSTTSTSSTTSTGETLDIGTWGPGVSVDHTFDEAGHGDHAVQAPPGDGGLHRRARRSLVHRGRARSRRPRARPSPSRACRRATTSSSPGTRS